MGKSNAPSWIDQARTKTAADVGTLDECDAYLTRLKRNLEELKEQRANTSDAPRNLRLAYFHRQQAIRELKARRAELCQV